MLLAEPILGVKAALTVEKEGNTVSNAVAKISDKATAETAKTLEKALEKLSQAVEEMTAEKEIIRDEDGRVVGARRKK